ncbi:Mis6-domain-containing protein [Xylariaceae sp. FL0255]|nr:Mis6-domain-containing protein [Xylariaceae sp. FL0255]
MSALSNDSEGTGQPTDRAYVHSGFHALDGFPDLKEHISDVIQASKLSTKQRGTSIKPTVEKLSSLAYDQGLLPTDLNELIDLVTTPSSLDQASLASIVRNLYPAASVSREIIVKVVGCLGHGKLKPSLAIQSALLKWLIMIQHVVENRNALSQTYPILFNLLDTSVLRSYVCHLLALITRRRHVRPHRIQTLLSLSRQTGNDPSLTGLLRIYKDYYPEIIVGDATRGKASAFKHPDLQWRERLDEIRRDHAQRRASPSETPLDAFRVVRHGPKDAKTLVVPEVHTSHATETSITLEEIENVDGFVKNLENIELPNQLIAVLNDPLLQKFLLLRPQAQAHQRACNWLNSFVQDILSGDSDAGLVDILRSLHNYVMATKNLPPMFLSFLSELMAFWDGQLGKSLVFDILMHTPLLDFQELLNHIFLPLEWKMLDGTTAGQLELLDFFTRLLRRWNVYLASAHERLTSMSESAGRLAAHVNDLCLTLMQTSPIVSTQSRIIDFYSQSSELASDAFLIRRPEVITIPPAPLVYNLFFTSSPTIISRLCAVVSRYKQKFQDAMTVTSANFTPRHIAEFNSFLMDICNCLWRSRALSVKDANANGCLTARPLAQDLESYVEGLSTGGSLASLFSLSCSPAFGLYAISYLREVEEAELAGTEGLDIRHAGPVTRVTLSTLGNRGGVRLAWDDYRLGVLSHLDNQGLDGISQLLSSTMTTLLRRNSSK